MTLADSSLHLLLSLHAVRSLFNPILVHLQTQACDSHKKEQQGKLGDG